MVISNDYKISDPFFFIEDTGSEQKKDKKASADKLARLATLVQVLEKDITEAKEGSGGKGSKVVNIDGTPTSNGTSNDDFGSAIARMVMALQMLQLKITEFAHDKANLDNEISQAQVEQANQHIKDVQQKLQQMQEDKAKQEVANIFIKIAECLVAAAVLVLSGGTLAGVVVAALTVLSVTGALSALTDGVSKLLQDCGVPAEYANIAAAVIVTIAIIAVTAGAGSGAAAEAGASEAAEAGEDAVEMSTMGAEGATTAASETTSIFTKVTDFLKGNSRLIMGIAGALQGVQQTGLANDIIEVTVKDPKEKQKIEMIVSIVLAVLAILATLAAGSAAEGGENAPKLSRLFGKDAEEFMQSTAFQKAVQGIRFVGSGGQLLASGTSGIIGVHQGNLQIDLSKCQAAFELLQVALGMNRTTTTEDQRFQADTLKQHSTNNLAISDLLKGEEAFANLFVNYSPV